MKRDKIFDFKPTHLQELSLRIKILTGKKEQEEKKIFNKIKKVFKR